MKSTCPFCGGTKVHVDDDSFTVLVEKGMQEDQTIVFEQEADEAPDTVPGDVIFRVKTAPHKRFTRKGNDLHMKMTISLLEVMFHVN